MHARQAQLEATIADVLRQAEEAGASQAEASASAGAGLSVTVRKQAVETLEYHRDQGLSVAVYFGQRKGSASTSDMQPDSLQETVRKACALAQYGAKDDAAGLADPERMARSFPDLELYHPWALETDQAIDLVTACEASALEQDGRINNSEGASVSSHEGCSVYGNSHGFLAGYPDSQHSLSCAVLAAEGLDMQRDFEYTVARDPGDLEGAEKIGREAAHRALGRLGARKLDTCVTPVIYPAQLARGLFGHAIGALSGGALYRQASFLLDCLEQPVFAPHITLTEKPFLPKGLGSAAFDGEGVATQERKLVEAGVLKAYVLSSYYARKLGLETTGNAGGIHNLQVSDTGVNYADLVEEMNTGFIVTELMGQGVNTVTGDYSRGASGFWVENGEIAYPVHEVTVAGNLRDMYKGIVAIATDLDCRGGIRSGSLLLDKVTIAGN
ncbi:MAG: metalloprotease PmbA [Gammaproteobacteria bacterium]|nr:metalloprotease PmbA [Gammaproteobacteria bacterium]MCP4089185.1 metalloprotease PmbA [Gammaproteobacteria bacterium]MCP4276791.1 metalloprotease PmbA [Gammaproteobacteria bacterium]MCP4830634.1 metalloprotease PmbA [Gammaproteobacteria bacterium]MCP4928443.1 metalloprotease PmbA [Gammaproteobacteria bacterium]